MTDVPDWAIERACNKCGAQFTPSAWMVRNSFRQCHECKRAYEREYRLQRKLNGDPIRHSAAKPGYRTERHRALVIDPAYRLRLNEKARARYWADPDRRLKVKARSLTSRAIQTGQIARQPCAVCADPNAEAHHDDYSQPLVVRWLCRTHHREHHTRERKA